MTLQNYEGDELTGVPWIAGAEFPHWRPASRDGGSSPVSGGGGGGSSPVAGEQGCAVTAQGCGARRGCAGVRELQVGHRDRGMCACVIGLGRIHKADTYQPTYPIFAKIIKIWILLEYVSMAYWTCIRIRYVSDT